MAQKTEFSYHNIELYKSESLGSGSYGGVCKAKCDGLLCAAKIMHPTLFDLHDPGTDSFLHKFQEECHLLSLARHPNVVQYLATYYDPDTKLPVLLMELCDESLTAFLERSPEPLSYYIQLNICHDIALALVYLHSNGVIHRDLTGNNVLIIAGPRAKITDFGMSKLATVNPRMTALTLCPGNALYMSPEALDASKSYSAKLDIFSFGVIVIQVLTRLFPDPTDRFREVHVPQFKGEVREVVPEIERREAHLKLIPDTHSLKPLALLCLNKEERQRPSAVGLSERLSELKQSSQYTDSMHQAKSRSDHIIQLLEDKDRQLQEYQHTIQNKDRRLQQLESEFQQSMQQKDKTISDLQQTISAQKRRVHQLQQMSTAVSGDIPKEHPFTRSQTIVAAVQRDISNMTWENGKNAPENMCRGAAIVHGNIAFFIPNDSQHVYSYENIHGKEQSLWSQLPDNGNINCGLTVLNGLLTTVGGSVIFYTNSLLSLTGEGERMQWSEVFPPMPTPRQNVACITTEQALVVAGGFAGDPLDTVEVMNIDTQQWTTATSLPQKISRLSGIVCGDILYLAGGNSGFENSNSVFSCSIPDLVPPPNKIGSRLRRSFSRSHNVWKESFSLPVTQSTLASHSGELLAIGGSNDMQTPTSDVYRYYSDTDSWNIVSQMRNKRSLPFAISLPEDRLIVVGGLTSPHYYESATDSVESLE